MQALGWQRAWHVLEAIDGRGRAQRPAPPVVIASVPLMSSCCEPEVSRSCHVFRKPLPLDPGPKAKSVIRFSGSQGVPSAKPSWVFPGPSTLKGPYLLSDLPPHQVGELWGGGGRVRSTPVSPNLASPVSGEDRACRGHCPALPLCRHSPGHSRASKHHAGSWAGETWARRAWCPVPGAQGTMCGAQSRSRWSCPH